MTLGIKTRRPSEAPWPIPLLGVCGSARTRAAPTRAAALPGPTSAASSSPRPLRCATRPPRPVGPGYLWTARRTYPLFGRNAPRAASQRSVGRPGDPAAGTDDRTAGRVRSGVTPRRSPSMPRSSTLKSPRSCWRIVRPATRTRKRPSSWACCAWATCLTIWPSPFLARSCSWERCRRRTRGRGNFTRSLAWETAFASLAACGIGVPR